MAEPDPIPTLFMLSLTALIDHVKNKKVKLSPDQIPTNIHTFLWDNSTVFDLIINTCHPETRNWFSTRVIKPPVLTVELKTGYYGNCLVKISFEGRRTVSWTLVRPDWPESPNPKFVIRTGNQYLSTQINQRNDGFISRLANHDRSRLEVVNWMCKAFRCEISELDVQYDHQIMKWPKLKTANSLRIRRFGRLEDLLELVVARQEINLKTSLDEVIPEEPIQPQLLQYINFNHAWLNLSNRTFDQLLEELRDLSKRERCSVLASTMSLSTEDFERIKAQLSFDNRSTTSGQNRMRMDITLIEAPEFKYSYLFNEEPNEKFYSYQDDKTISYKFIWARPNTYNGFIMNIYQ